MRTTTVGVLTVLFVAGCAPPPATRALPSPVVSLPPPEKLQPVSLSAAEMQGVERGLKAKLKDPDSAKIEGVVAGKDTSGRTFVCGLVNAKNSYGGFTGKMPFRGIMEADTSGNPVLIPSAIATPLGVELIAGMCDKDGLPVGSQGMTAGRPADAP